MSPSKSPTRWPSCPRRTARLAATVDFPTPPLPLATATMCRTPGARFGFCEVARCAAGSGPAGVAGRCIWIATWAPAAPGTARTARSASARTFSAASGLWVAICRLTSTSPPSDTLTSCTNPKETMSRLIPGKRTAFRASHTLASRSFAILSVSCLASVCGSSALADGPAGGKEYHMGTVSIASIAVRYALGHLCEVPGTHAGKVGQPPPHLRDQLSFAADARIRHRDPLSATHLDRSRPDRPLTARLHRPCAANAHRHDRQTRAQGEQEPTALERQQGVAGRPRAFGKHQDRAAAGAQPLLGGGERLPRRRLVGAVDGNESRGGQRPAEDRDAEQAPLGHEPETLRQGDQQRRDVEQALMVGQEDVARFRVELSGAPHLEAHPAGTQQAGRPEPCDRQRPALPRRHPAHRDGDDRQHQAADHQVKIARHRGKRLARKRRRAAGPGVGCAQWAALPSLEWWVALSAIPDLLRAPRAPRAPAAGPGNLPC